MTTKKPVASLAKETVKAADAKITAEVKTAVETKAADTTTADTTTADTKATAEVKKTAPADTTVSEKKETVKKAPAKKAAKATTAKKKAAEAKATVEEAKETVKKAVASKTTKKNVMVAVQFADKNYTMEDLEKIANDVWVYDYNKKASELKDIQLYVKPEEAKVYYVFNNEITGDFNI